MKRKQVYLFLTMAVVMTIFTGCGNQDENDTTTPSTEEKVADNNDTEEVTEPTENTNQLQLGTAVEIPEGWEGSLADTQAHEQLEKLIAEYYSIPEDNWEGTRYYYNFVDLNGDSQEEILTMVVQGNENAPNAANTNTNTGKTKSVSSDVEKINETEQNNAVAAPNTESDVMNGTGSSLLWIDAGNNDMKPEHIRQEFKNVKSPVYISNHMTEGHRDLIVCENTKDKGAAGYRLLKWDGNKYTEVEKGEKLESLEGYEGEAVLTNNMEINGNVEDYHFLGKSTKNK